MRILPLFQLLLAVVLLGFVQGCESDDDQIRQFLSGRWELVEAFRNEKATETLTGTFFVFTEEGKMTTNLPVGADAPVPFTLENKIIAQQTPQTIRYAIQEISDSSLVLTLELRGVNFEMHFQRANAEMLPPPEPMPSDTTMQEDNSDTTRSVQ